ncbi:Double-stranded RNA-binding protein 1 [Abeliophyllum distichum]|uniref:Double-stranded RNA-binding protein 1 n=1 Tax=Abeliophyllum distichum TaxID=126358 RepID=A0ABD1SUB4_9LAMI
MGEPENLKAPTAGIAEEVSYKNRLQQFTQRASIPLPVYKTFCEAQHPPSFRSRVWVNGTCFTSNTCPCKKMAEQEVAKLALADVIRKVKDEGSSLIREGKVTTVLCKSIMNEYAVKMNMERPTYDTVQPKGLLPVFVSSLIFNGVTFTGDTATNKKEAENFAARSAILSILGSESGTTMSEIVRSKFRLFDEFKSRKDSSMVDDGSMPIGVNPGEKLVSLNKRKEVEVNGDTVNDTFASLDPTLENPSVVQGAHLPLHEFKKPRPEPLLEATAPPIVFVPPALELSLLSSTSGKKKKRKNKKAKKKMLVDSQ